MPLTRFARLIVSIALLGCGADSTPQALQESDRWPERNDFPGVSAAGVMVTTDGNDDTLSVVDVATRERIFVAPIGLSPIEPEGPHHLRPSPDQRFLYVPLSNYAPVTGSGPHGSHGTGAAPGFLIKIRTSDFREVARANLKANPGDIVLTRDGSTAFVSHFNLFEATRILREIGMGMPREIAEMDSYVGKVRTSDMSVEFIRICPTGHGMTLSPDERTLYVTCSLSDELAIIDLGASPPRVERVKVASDAGDTGSAIYEPYAVTRSPLDGRLWISNTPLGDARSLSVFDPQKHAITKTLYLRSSPQFGSWSKDGITLMVPAKSPDTVLFVDTRPGQEGVTESLPVDPNRCVLPHAIALDKSEETAFLVCEQDGQMRGSLLAFTVATHAILGTTELGVFPNGLTLLLPEMR